MYLRIRSRDNMFSRRKVIGSKIKGNAKSSKFLHKSCSHKSRSFHNSSGQYDSIYTSHKRRICSNIFDDTIDIHIHGNFTLEIMTFYSCNNISHIRRDSRDSQKPAFFVHQSIHLIRSQSFMPHNIRNNCRINTSTSRTHHQSF